MLPQFSRPTYTVGASEKCIGLSDGDRFKGEFNLDIMSQSGYWSYISVNNFHPLVVAFCTLVKKL